MVNSLRRREAVAINSKAILAFSGAVVVGTIGSAVWDLTKPYFLWIMAAGLDLATFGINSLVDEIYAEVARAENRAAEKAMAFSSNVYLFPFWGLGAAFYLSKKRSLSRENWRWGAVGSRAWVGVLICVAATLFVMVNSLRTVYISRAAVYMDQMYRIAAPYIDEQDRLMVVSRIAAMESRHEFLTILNELKQIARENGANVPQFDVY